jgi:hypothetical protein
MSAQLTNGDRWQRESPPATLRLWLDKLELAIDSLQLLGDVKSPDIEVDVLPAQSECLALSKPKGQCH